ncbi:MAG: zinc-dependent alcohol dehydrogenase family protein [bacterium]
MQAVVIENPRTVQTAELARPDPGEGQMLIRVRACGVCGTDVHIYKGEYLGDYPVIPGHEFAGEVVEVGPGMTAFERHDRVAVEPNIHCGHCRFCRLGEPNFCENWRAIGVTLPGAMADYVVVPASAAFPIGDLPYEAAVFMEPLSCVLHGMEKLAVRYGETVLVIGAGPIGLLLAQVARASGAARVVVADRVVSRLELAAELVPDAVADTSGGWEPAAAGGYDVVIEATGAPAVFEQSIELVRSGGRILVFGVAPREATAEVKPFRIFEKGLQVVSSYTSVRNSEQALALLRAGRVRVDRLVTHRLPLDGFEEAMDLLADPEGAMKIQLIPGD